jgi:hypothetical protein
MIGIPAFLSRSLVALVAFVHIPAALSQTPQWNSTNGNWNDSGSWSTGTVPSGTGVAIIFNNTSGATYDVAVADANPTVGSITASGNSNNRNVRLGNASDFSGTLTLAATDPAGSPVLSAATGMRLAIFCELAGTQGFTKSGGGFLNFSTNTLSMNNLSGPIRIGEGLVTIQEAGNLGNGDIVFTGNATLELAASITANHSANKTLTINPGATATLTNIGGTAQTIFSGPVAGSGNIVFNGGNFTLSGENTFSGSVRIQSARIFLGENKTLTTGAVSFYGNSTLNFGGRTQSFSNLSVIGGVSTNATFTNGSLSVVGSGDFLLGGGISNSTLDLSQLGSISMNSSAGIISIAGATSNALSNNTVSLPSSGNNTLRANSVVVGGIGSSTVSNQPVRHSMLRLGTQTTIQANLLQVGQSGASGSVLFHSGSGNLTLRNSAGAGSVGNWTIGSATFSGAAGNGDMNFGTGRLEASFTNLTVANHSTTISPNLAGNLSFSSGNLTGTNITLARKSSGGSQLVNATINQSGGTTTIQNLVMGVGGDSLATLNPAFRLTGGTLAAWSINASGGNFHTRSNRTISMSGNATLRNRSNGNLSISGFNSSPGGRLNLSVEGPANFFVDGTRTFTVGLNSLLSGSGNITKSGLGTLHLTSNLSHTYNGTIACTQGRIESNAPLPSASLTLTSGTLAGSGPLRDIHLSSGILEPGAGLGNFTAGNLTWNSTATIRCDLSGSNSSDRIVLSGNLTQGNGTQFTFDFQGGGSPGGSYILATFAGHSFNSTQFVASNLAPGLTGSFALGDSSLTLNISGATSQTIEEFSVADRVATDAPFSIIPPAATSGLPVVLSIKSGNATISGNTITLTGSGSVIVAANQAGNATFAAAEERTATFNVARASQTISFNPIASRRLSEGSFTVAPTATSALGVTLTRRSGPATVNGTTVTPTGVGTVVLAANQAGNNFYLPAAEVTTSFTVMNNLTTLTVVEPDAQDGSIPEGFAGTTDREIGTSISITATPASGMRLLRWLRDGTQVSTLNTYTFTMNASTTLEPVFVPNFGVLLGTYNGLVGDGSIGEGSPQDMAEFPLNNGYITLVATSTGNFTGNLTLENQTDPFSGSFGNNKTAEVSIARVGKSSVTGNLILSTALPGEISGHINVDEVDVPFRAKRVSYSGNSTTYTMVLAAPSNQSLGYSFATVIFSSAGTGSFVGRLSTNETFSTTRRIVQSDDGNDWVLPLYIQTMLSGNATGLITGEVAVPKNPAQGVPAVTAAFEWLREANPSSLLVPDGFLTTVGGVGSVLSTANGTSMLTGDTSSGNFTLTLDPGTTTLPSAIHQPATWSSNNTVSLIAPVSSNLTFGSVARSGASIGSYSGTFRRDVSGIPTTTRYYGTVFTNPVAIEEGGPELRGAGFFITTNSTVPVIMTAP